MTFEDIKQAQQALALAQQAWNAIRGHDPEFHELPMEMRHKLNRLAEKALTGRAEAEGDYAPAGFFAKVRELSPDEWFDLPGGRAVKNRRVKTRRAQSLPQDPATERRKATADRRALEVHFGRSIVEQAVETQLAMKRLQQLHPITERALSQETLDKLAEERGPFGEPLGVSEEGVTAVPPFMPKAENNLTAFGDGDGSGIHNQLDKE